MWGFWKAKKELQAKNSQLERKCEKLQKDIDDTYDKQIAYVHEDLLNLAVDFSKKLRELVYNVWKANHLDACVATLFKDAKGLQILVNILSKHLSKHILIWTSENLVEITANLCLGVVDMYGACHTYLKRKPGMNTYHVGVLNSIHAYMESIKKCMSQEPWTRNRLATLMHALEKNVEKAVRQNGNNFETLQIKSEIPLRSSAVTELMLQELVYVILEVNGIHRADAVVEVDDAGVITIRRKLRLRQS